jgi:hypothetical protein
LALFAANASLATLMGCADTPGIVAPRHLSQDVTLAKNTTSSKIVFESGRDENVEVCVMNIDGTGVTRP